MKKVFDRLAERHAMIVKQAFLPAMAAGIGRAMLGAGKVVVRNPLRTLTGAGVASEVVGNAQQMGDAASQARGMYYNMAGR